MNNRQFHRRFKFDEYVFTWSYKFAAGWFAIGGAGSALALILLSFGWSSVVIGGGVGAVVASGSGLVYGLLTRAELFDQLMLEYMDGDETAVNPPARTHTPPTRQDLTVKLNLDNGRGLATIYQPTAGAFARWLRETLESDRVFFSQRQAMARGFSDEQYKTVVSQLKAVGLLHAKETKNGTPVITENGAVRAREWLSVQANK